MYAERNVLLVALTAGVGALIIGVGVGRYAIPASETKDDEGERTRAAQALTTARVRAAVPALEAWHADHNTYEGATLVRLQSYDAGVSGVRVVFGTRGDYCLESRIGQEVASKRGPGGEVVQRPCGA